MTTSWENECKVRAEPSLLGFCRTAAAFMKLIMAAHTSWHSSEAASGEKQSKEKNGVNRFLSLPMSKPPPNCGWYATRTLSCYTTKYIVGFIIVLSESHATSIFYKILSMWFFKYNGVSRFLDGNSNLV